MHDMTVGINTDWGFDLSLHQDIIVAPSQKKYIH